MNSVINFLVKDLLGQASILIAFIALIGLVLQKNRPGRSWKGPLKPFLAS